MPAITGFRYVALVAMTYLTSAALYSRIPEPYCGPGCNMALARPLIAFVLPTAIGSCEVVPDVKKDEIAAAMRSIGMPGLP